MDTVDLRVKNRTIDAIYNYMLRTIYTYEKQKYIQFNFHDIIFGFPFGISPNYDISLNNNNKIFQRVDDSFKLCKSLQYIHKNMRFE